MEYFAQLSTLFVCCNAKSFIFSHALKPDLEGAFQREILKFFILLNKHLLISEVHVFINGKQGYLGTENRKLFGLSVTNT